MSRGFQFTEEQIKYIIDNWGKEAPYSMKKRFGCTWYAIAKVAERNGLELPKANIWTEEEINTLRVLSSKFHYKKIAKIMNKSENAIYLKAKRLGITLIQNRREWTKEEEETLSDLWGNKQIEYIAKKLNRTIFSLKVKAIRMNLGSMIGNNSEIITISDMTEILDVTRDRIINTWTKLGLKLNNKKLTSNASYYYVTLNDLLEFLKNHQNEWDSRNLEKNILGLEPNWLKEKRKKDKEDNPLWYRRWTEEEINTMESLFKIGKTYEEIGVIMNRSEASVANALRNLGYSYRVPKYWKGNELKFLQENYQKLTYKEIAEILGRTEKAVSAKIYELGYQKKKKK